MQLAPEDALRLNVMLANQPQAIRIDESRMILYALSQKGEMEIPLHPTIKDDPYLKLVRELLSSHVLGTPAGYPTHIQRWTRMGQLRNENVEDLLLLGVEEAVVAVVYSENLSHELARRAWWAMEDAENARQMLRVPAVAGSDLGAVLAHYLVEFLPFETESEQIMETIRLVLQPGLLSSDEQLALWQRARRKNAIYMGFLATLPDALPEASQAHYAAGETAQIVAAGNGHSVAQLLARAQSASGQLWLQTLKRVLEKPPNQDVVNAAMDVAAAYFAAARPEGRADATLEQLMQEAEQWLESQPDALLGYHTQAPQWLCALRVLSGSGYGVVRPVFAKTDAIGTLMRRKLKPVLEPYMAQIDCLLN